LFDVKGTLDIIGNKFDLMSENVKELILIVDTDKIIEFINVGPHLKILGYNEKDLIGNSWLDLVHTEDLKNASRFLNINAEPKYLTKVIKLRHNNGHYKQFELVVKAFEDHDNTIKFMIFLRDITEIVDSREIKKKLKESEEQFKTITEQSLMGIIILQDNKIKYVSDITAEMVGYHPEELLNLPPGGFINFIYPEDREIVIEQAQKRQKGIPTKISGYECRCFKKNGDIIWLQTYSKTVIFDHRFADLIVIINITDKKKAEIKLHESEKRLKFLLSSCPTIIYTLNCDENNKFVFISKNVEDITGYKLEEFINDSEFWISKVHPDDKNRIYPTFSKLKKNEGIGLEYRFKFKNGIYHWINDEINSVRDENGNIIEYIGSWTDITAIKRTQEKIQYQSKLVNEISDAIVSTDLNLNIITWNKAAEIIYGWKTEEVRRKYVENIIPLVNPDDNQKLWVKKLFKHGIWRGEVIQKKKDGTPLQILTSISIIKDINGNPIGVVAINRDITEYKKSEKKVRESEKLLVELIEAVPVGVSITTPQGNILECNSHALKIFGYNSKEEFLKTSVLDFYLDPNERKRFTQLIQKGLVKDFETRFKRKDGTIFWISINSITQYNKNKLRFINSFQNITERKSMEAALKESEARLKTAIDSLPFDVFMLNEKGYYIMQNTTCLKAWGNAIGKTPKDVAPNKDILTIWENNNSRAFSSETVTGEVVFEIKGKTRYYYNIINPIFIDKKVQNIIGVNIDITQLKLAEKKLKESEEKFRILAEHSVLGIIIYQNGLFKYINSAVSDIFEYPLQKIEKWTLKDICNVIRSDNLPQTIEYLEKHQQEDFKEVFKFDCIVGIKSKMVKWVEVILKSTMYRGMNAILISLIDKTKIKKAEEELIEISKLKSELLTRTSHELKTPLVTIKGYVDLLLNPHYKNLDFQTVSIINEIKQGCSRMENLVKDLLTTSKLESENIELNKLEEDLSFLIRFSVKEIRLLVMKRNHSISLDIHEKMVTMFEKERLYEVIMNLLLNAINYTPPNGLIKIKSQQKNGFYVISIKDSGIGITKQEKKKIFKKFGKVERYGQGMDVFSEGTGLGLFISKRIIELHGGKIWLKSKGKNKGSTFYFSLPILTK
jgi:PAS domain S-box-containing protein